jgi:hypothetical protein
MTPRSTRHPQSAHIISIDSIVQSGVSWAAGRAELLLSDGRGLTQVTKDPGGVPAFGGRSSPAVGVVRGQGENVTRREIGTEIDVIQDGAGGPPLAIAYEQFRHFSVQVVGAERCAAEVRSRDGPGP